MRNPSLLLLVLLAMLVSACATAPRREPPRVQVTPPPTRAVAVCRDCGRIERVELVSNVRPTAQGRAVLGGVVGGVVAGPPPPAAAAKPGVQVLSFRVAVRMDDGRRLVLLQPALAAGLKAGSRVRVANKRVWPPR